MTHKQNQVYQFQSFSFTWKLKFWFSVSFVRINDDRVQEDSQKATKTFNSWLFYALLTVIIVVHWRYVYVGQLSCVVAKYLQEGCVTLLIKLLNFFIATWFRFRYVAPILPSPFSGKLMFWIVLSRSVSELYYWE